MNFDFQNRSRRKITIFLGLSLLAVVCGPRASAVTAYETPPGGWASRTYGLSARVEYFVTQANYDNVRGSYSRLPNENKFSTIQSTFRGRYNFTTKFSTFAGLGLGYSQATDNVYHKTNSQITEVFGGANWLLHRQYFRIVPEVLVSIPMHPTDPNQTEPMTSDGVPYIRSGLFAHKPFRKFRLGAFGGFHIPLSDLGTRFAYEVTADMRLFSIVTLGGGISGYETFLADRSTRESRLQTAQRANAGSFRYYAFEPALIEARGWIGFRPDRTLWIRVGLAKTLNGIDTAEGFSITGSISFNPQPPTVVRTSAPQRYKYIRPDESSAQRSFEPDTEDVDYDLFESEEAEVLPSSGEDALDQTEKLLEKKNRSK